MGALLRDLLQWKDVSPNMGKIPWITPRLCLEIGEKQGKLTSWGAKLPHQQ